MDLKSFTLARLKGIAAFLGSALTFATTLDWGFTIPVWVTAVSAILTFVAVYGIPNIETGPAPRRELVEDEELGR